MTSNEVAQDWRWRKVGDPFGSGEMEGQPPPGELRDAGATVTAYQAALPRLSLCPVSSQARVRWVASMTLPAPAHLPLPLGRGCTPDHAVAAAPTDWAGVAERLARDGEHHRTRLESGDGLASERLAELLPRQAEACAFLAAAVSEVRPRALALWHEHPDWLVAEDRRGDPRRADKAPEGPVMSDVPMGRRWAWRRVDPGLLMERRPRHDVAPKIEEHLREPVGVQGWALADVATGEPVLLVDDGYGSPTVAGGLPGPVADLLARAPELEAQVQRLQQALLSDSPALRAELRRNLAAQDELVEEFGLLAAADVARLAGSTAAEPERLVRDWRERGRVFVVPTTMGPRLPGFQFDERGVPLPAVAGVLAAFADRRSAWDVALWFTGGTGWLGGRRPVDVLDSDSEVVVQAAARLAEELS